MNKSEFWNKFIATGSVQDYLNYAAAPTEEVYEAQHRRTDTEKQKNGRE